MPGGELLYRLSCTYDRAGNRDGREEQYRDAVSGSIHTAVTSYAYDSMGRLTGETLDGETACYSYDHAGNRLTRTGAGRTEHYRYNSRNQLTELDSTAGTVRYEYDPAGSLTAEVHTVQGGSSAERTGYTYDAYNRNTSVCGAGYVQQNHYDAEGLRYAVTENGETTNFVYRNGMPVSELDADKNPVRGYVLGNEYISQSDGTSFGYYLNDEQGSVRYLTGSDGSIRNHYRYSAFGETITAEETVPNRLRYNGQMADGLTGLYYLRARYYNASLGRFTQEDVIYNDGLNLYVYCNSNPVMYSDPSGFAKQCDPKIGGEKDSKSGKATGKYQVGAYQDIKGVDGLDAHHVGQKAVMKKLVADYDELTAPAINVPKLGHTKRHPERGIVSRSTKGITNAGQLLARDLFELKRVYPDIPNSTLKELIDMNKKMYSEMRK